MDGFLRILNPRTSKGIKEYEPTAPESLARALLLLAQISAKRLENCTFSGGVDCAWLAAVAEFLFRLTVDIKSPDGGYLYRSNGIHHGEAQVTFLKDFKATTGTELTRKCFSLPNGCELLHTFDRLKDDREAFVSHSQWTGLMGDAFGSDVEELLRGQASIHFATLLVYLSRAPHWSTLTTPRGLYHIQSLQYGPRTLNGDDLLRFAARQLPELQYCLEAVALRSLSIISEHQAMLHLMSIRKLCRCRGCPGDGSFYTYPDGCLLRLVKTIIITISSLSAANVKGVLPSVRGLRTIYSRREPTLINSTLLDIIFDLFSSPRDTTSNKALATAELGVCCFYNLLTDTRSPPQLAGLVSVMPGHIEYEGSVFERIEDLPIELEYPSKDSNSSTVPFQWVTESKLFVSETMRSDTLQTALSSKGGVSCMSRISSIIAWIHKSSVDACELQRNEKMDCDFHHLSSQLSLDSRGHTCKSSGDTSSKLSLMYIVCPAPESIQGGVREFLIYKTSSKIWEDPGFNVGQLYANYGRFYIDTSVDVSRAIMTEASDCPKCVINIMAERMLLPEVPFAQGHIVFHTAERVVFTCEFKLRLPGRGSFGFKPLSISSSRSAFLSEESEPGLGISKKITEARSPIGPFSDFSSKLKRTLGDADYTPGRMPWPSARPATPWSKGIGPDVIVHRKARKPKSSARPAPENEFESRKRTAARKYISDVTSSSDESGSDVIVHREVHRPRSSARPVPKFEVISKKDRAVGKRSHSI